MPNANFSLACTKTRVNCGSVEDRMLIRTFFLQICVLGISAVLCSKTRNNKKNINGKSLYTAASTKKQKQQVAMKTNKKNLEDSKIPQEQVNLKKEPKVSFSYDEEVQTLRPSDFFSVASKRELSSEAIWISFEKFEYYHQWV